MNDKDREELLQGIGWLRQALSQDHPGYLAEQVRRAEEGGYTTTANGLRHIARIGR